MSRPRIGPGAIVLIWLAQAALLLLFAWPSVMTMKATDPDDYMRLLEVRDWLSGQPWFDVHQYRMAPPAGVDMHWSRLVDLPIAALLAGARLFLPDPAASSLAMAGVPLIELLVAMLLLFRLQLALSHSARAATIAAAVPLLFPTLASNFMPMRIDHHAWQGICILACALALQATSQGAPPRGAMLAGLLAGLALNISLETVIPVAAIGLLMARRWWQRADASLAAFSGALAFATIGLALLTHGAAPLLLARADQVTWPHFLAMTFVAVGAALLRPLLGPARPRVRLIASLLLAEAGAAVLLGSLGAAAIDPFHGIDPLVRRLWLENVAEGMPIAGQNWSVRLTLVWTPVLVVFGWLSGRRGPDIRRWDELAFLAMVCCASSLFVMRGAVTAQLLAIPFSVGLIARFLPRAAALPSPLQRVPAIIACLTLLTPSLASAAGHLLDSRTRPAPASGSPAPGAAGPVGARARQGSCDLASLGALPPTRIFTLLDNGPEILVRTRHSVTAGPYHRAPGPMREVIEAFSGDPARARAIVQASRARVLAFCPLQSEAAIYAARRSDNLANLLLTRRPPAWLQPVSAFAGSLQVYRVVDRP